MSIKDQIRQEFERRRDICKGIFERDSDTYYQGKAVAYDESISIIDSLPEEKLSYVTDSPGAPGPPGEPGISDLEEAAKKYAHCPFTDDDGNFHEDAIDETAYRDFIAGAEWQKEQMMKEAVEAKVWESEHGFRDLEMDSELFRKALEGFNDGDKVKLIIVKEDEG